MLEVFERTRTTGCTVHFLWCLTNHDIVMGRVCTLYVGRYGVRFPSGERSLSVLLSVQMGSGATQWVPVGDITAGMCS